MTSSYNYEFNDSAELSDWDVISGNPLNIAMVNGELILGANTTAQDDVIILLHKDLIPFDGNAVYAWNLHVPPFDPVNNPVVTEASIGFIGYAADGITVVDALGGSTVAASHWHVLGEAALTSPISTFTRGFGATYGDYEPYGSGHDGSFSNPFKVHPNVRYMRLAIAANIQFWQGAYAQASICHIYSLSLVETYDTPGIGQPDSVYTITPSAISVSRNFFVTFDLSATNFSNGNIYWEVVPTNASCTATDFTTVQGGQAGAILPKGTAFVVSGSGSVTLYTTNNFDSTQDKFILRLRTGSESGSIVADSEEITIEVQPYSYAMLASTYPETSFPYTTGEGGNVAVAIRCSQLSTGTLVPWLITGVQIEDIAAMSINNVAIVPSLSGNFVIPANSLDYSFLGIQIANDSLLEATEVLTVTLSDPSGNLRLPSPPPSVFFNITGVYIPNEINNGLQTFDANGNVIIDMSAKSFMAVVQGTASLNNNADGTTYQDFYITGMAPDENWTVSLHLPDFKPSYKIWHEVFIGYFRVYFYRNTAAGYAPQSVTCSYAVYRS